MCVADIFFIELEQIEMAVLGTTFTIPPAVTKKYNMGDEIAR